MKIMFLAVGWENLAIEYLSAILKKNGFDTALCYDPSLFDDKYYFDLKYLARLFSIRKILLKQIIDYSPDLIAISVFTQNYIWAKSMIKEIKKIKDIKVILGGVHPTILPELTLNDSAADFICVGEGDIALPLFCAALRDNKDISDIPNIWMKRDNKIIAASQSAPLINNLDDLPLPDKTLFKKYVNIQDVYMILTSRGCIHNCSYCGAGALQNLIIKKNENYNIKYYRRRSVENVIAELEYAKKEFNIKTVNFVDNIFTLEKNWTLTFLEEYRKKINLPFRCLTYPNNLDDDIAKSLKISKCYQISIGVQSLDETVRKKILNRNISNTIIFETFKILEKNKLNYNVDHILGIHTENFDAHLKALLIYSDYKPSHITCYWLTYLPGTEMLKYAVHLNILSQEDLESILHGELSAFHSTEKKNIKYYEKINMLFSLLPLLPKPLKKIMIKQRLYKLAIRPLFLKTIFDTLTAFKYRDLEIFYFIKYYTHWFFRIIFIKFIKLKR